MKKEFRQLLSDAVDEIFPDFGVKVYYGVVPLSAEFPCVRYFQVSEENKSTKDIAKLAAARLQVDIYAKNDIIDAAAILEFGSKYIEQWLDRYIGSGIIQEIRLETKQDDYEEEIEAHIVRHDYIVLYAKN